MTLGAMLCGAMLFGWRSTGTALRRVRRSWLLVSGAGECLVQTGFVLVRRRGGDRLLVVHLGLTGPSRRAESLRQLPRRRFVSFRYHADRPGLKLAEFGADLSCPGLGRIRLGVFAGRSGRS